MIVVCLVLLAGRPPPAAAEGISIEYATSRLAEDSYLLDARIRYDFSDELLLALNHGVDLYIDVMIRINRERRWLWDPVIAEETLRFLLQHHPLSDDYIVTDLVRDARHQFSSADAALKFLGTIKNHRLFPSDVIRNGASYLGHIRAQLNIEQLPAPLQPVAYVSTEWRLQSPWYEWVIQ